MLNYFPWNESPCIQRGFHTCGNRSWHGVVVVGGPTERWLCAVCLPRVLQAVWGRSAVATLPPPFCPAAPQALSAPFLSLTCTESPLVRPWHAAISRRASLQNAWSLSDAVQTGRSFIQRLTIECNGSLSGEQSFLPTDDGGDTMQRLRSSFSAASVCLMHQMLRETSE